MATCTTCSSTLTTHSTSSQATTAGCRSHMTERTSGGRRTTCRFLHSTQSRSTLPIRITQMAAPWAVLAADFARPLDERHAEAEAGAVRWDHRRQLCGRDVHDRLLHQRITADRWHDLGGDR